MKQKIIAFVGLCLAVILWLMYPVSGVPILEYHQVLDDQELYSIDSREFEEQMKYLADHHYTAISLQELADGLEGKIALPAKPVVITFDDGYRDNLTNALPIMEKYDMKATVFVIPHDVGTQDYLDWDEIREMQMRGTEIQSHTMNHVALPDISFEQCLSEVVESKAVIETQIGGSVGFLSYPFGKYNSEVVQALQEAGYRGGCTGHPGFNAPGQNLFQLKRVNIPRPKFGLWEFKLRMLKATIYSKL